MWGGRLRPQPGPLAGLGVLIARPGGRARVRGPAPPYGNHETALAAEDPSALRKQRELEALERPLVAPEPGQGARLIGQIADEGVRPTHTHSPIRAPRDAAN